MHASGMSGILLLVMSVATPLPAQSRLRSAARSPATIEGHVTVAMAIGHTFGTHPVADLQLYLFRVEDSRPLQEHQRRCRRAVGQNFASPTAAYDTCMDGLEKAAKLVPNLPATATTRTDREGFYRFENIRPEQRYQVVAVKYEGESPEVIVGLTGRLKPGEHATLDLSENDPWTEALPPQR